MLYKDVDYAIVGKKKFGSRMSAINTFRQIYANTRNRQRAGRLVRRASYPAVDRPQRHPVQSDDRFEIAKFASFLDDFQEEWSDVQSPASLDGDLVEMFDALGQSSIAI